MLRIGSWNGRTYRNCGDIKLISGKYGWVLKNGDFLVQSGIAENLVEKNMPSVNIFVSFGKVGFNTKPPIPSEQVVPLRPFFQSALDCHTRREDRLLADFGLPIQGPGRWAWEKLSETFRVEKGVVLAWGWFEMFQQHSQFNPIFFKHLYAFDWFNPVSSGHHVPFFPTQEMAKRPSQSWLNTVLLCQLAAEDQSGWCPRDCSD